MAKLIDFEERPCFLSAPVNGPKVSHSKPPSNGLSGVAIGRNMMTPRIKQALDDPTVHYFTKLILCHALKLDALDATYDVQLAYTLLSDRLDILLGRKTDEANL